MPKSPSKTRKASHLFALSLDQKFKSLESKSEIGCFGLYPHFGKINIFVNRRTKLVA